MSLLSDSLPSSVAEQQNCSSGKRANVAVTCASYWAPRTELHLRSYGIQVYGHPRQTLARTQPRNRFTAEESLARRARHFRWTAGAIACAAAQIPWCAANRVLGCWGLGDRQLSWSWLDFLVLGKASKLSVFSLTLRGTRFKANLALITWGWLDLLPFMVLQMPRSGVTPVDHHPPPRMLKEIWYSMPFIIFWSSSVG